MAPRIPPRLAPRQLESFHPRGMGLTRFSTQVGLCHQAEPRLAGKPNHEVLGDVAALQVSHKSVSNWRGAPLPPPIASKYSNIYQAHASLLAFEYGVRDRRESFGETHKLSWHVVLISLEASSHSWPSG